MMGGLGHTDERLDHRLIEAELNGRMLRWEEVDVGMSAECIRAWPGASLEAAARALLPERLQEPRVLAVSLVLMIPGTVWDLPSAGRPKVIGALPPPDDDIWCHLLVLSNNGLKKPLEAVKRPALLNPIQHFDRTLLDARLTADGDWWFCFDAADEFPWTMNLHGFSKHAVFDYPDDGRVYAKVNGF